MPEAGPVGRRIGPPAGCRPRRTAGDGIWADRRGRRRRAQPQPHSRSARRRSRRAGSGRPSGRTGFWIPDASVRPSGRICASSPSLRLALVMPGPSGSVAHAIEPSSTAFRSMDRPSLAPDREQAPRAALKRVLRSPDGTSFHRILNGDAGVGPTPGRPPAAFAPIRHGRRVEYRDAPDR